MCMCNEKKVKLFKVYLMMFMEIVWTSAIWAVSVLGRTVGVGLAAPCFIIIFIGAILNIVFIVSNWD